MEKVYKTPRRVEERDPPALNHTPLPPSSSLPDRLVCVFCEFVVRPVLPYNKCAIGINRTY